jgi:hypothetical protein
MLAVLTILRTWSLKWNVNIMIDPLTLILTLDQDSKLFKGSFENFTCNKNDAIRILVIVALLL